eukprot:scaffold151611_cov28-Tisochrysis_lutea.AAC.2
MQRYATAAGRAGGQAGGRGAGRRTEVGQIRVPRKGHTRSGMETDDSVLRLRQVHEYERNEADRAKRRGEQRSRARSLRQQPGGAQRGRSADDPGAGKEGVAVGRTQGHDGGERGCGR